MNRVAVLMTCFNRKQKTLACLDALFKLSNKIDVFVVDDGSTDGTNAEVKMQYPQVTLLEGSGSLYWNRGMRLAWLVAQEKDYDFYIWLNDDVKLLEWCFEELFACSHIENNQSLIVGIVQSEDGREILYGGTGVGEQLLQPNGDMQDIRNMNGNVVLVPRSVFSKLGNLCSVYHHDLGDIDYGYRAKRCGISVKTTRMAVAVGYKNDICRVRKAGVSVVGRFRKLYSPLGSPPIINFYFRAKYFGAFNAITYFVFLHVLNVLPDGVVRLFFGKRYI